MFPIVAISRQLYHFFAYEALSKLLKLLLFKLQMETISWLGGDDVLN